MGLVSFSTPAVERRFGFLLDDRIIGLSLEHNEGENLPEELQQLEKTREQLSDERNIENNYNVFDVSEVTFHPPVTPPRIIRLEACYAHDVTDSGFNPHLEKHGLTDRDMPMLWIAPESSLSGPEQSVPLPRNANDVRPGAELAVVINNDCKQVEQAEAFEYVAGALPTISLAVYDETPGIDGYKMYDSFLTTGREVVPLSEKKLMETAIELQVNGERHDTRAVDSLRFTIPEMVSFASNVMTLRQGDIVVTGTPTRVDYSLQEGDEITTIFSGLGRVITNVVK